MHDGHQNCVLAVDADDYLEGILTYGDTKRCLFKTSGDASVSDSSLPDVCSFTWNDYMVLFIPFDMEAGHKLFL